MAIWIKWTQSPCSKRSAFSKVGRYNRDTLVQCVGKCMSVAGHGGSQDPRWVPALGKWKAGQIAVELGRLKALNDWFSYGVVIRRGQSSGGKEHVVIGL